MKAVKKADMFIQEHTITADDDDVILTPIFSSARGMFYINITITETNG